MAHIPAPSSTTFQDFATRVTDATFVEQLARDTSWNIDELGGRLVLAAGEAAQTLRVLAGLEVRNGERIIEIGAGLGLTSALLSNCGFDVTALEPAGIGFEEHRTLARRVAAIVGSNHEVLTIPAEELVAAVHGRFGLVFSNNVLEHVDDPVSALSSLAAIMTADGVMVHSCPNYSIPFEPHFGIPLLPLRPRWTRRVLPTSIGASGLWRSLNFIRARDVVRATHELGLSVDFRSGALATSIERLDNDSEFRARHRALAVVAGGLRRSGIVALLRHLPAAWSTPMDFLISGPACDPRRVERWLNPASDR